jgi:hypothetical protein
MDISVKEAHAKKVWFKDNDLWILLADGRQLSVPLSYFPRLLHATEKQRKNYIISGGGTGLHWEEIDEDISVNGLLLGIGDRTI